MTQIQRILVSLVPAAALALCLYAVEVPYFVESPGSARSVLPLIDVDGRATYDSEGRYLLTTVNLGRGNTYDVLRAWVDPAAYVLHERLVVPPGQTDAEYERVALSQMDQSKIAAVAVALERLAGYPSEHGPGVVVQDTLPGFPAHGVLFAGDLITAVDGEPLEGLRGLRRAIDRAGVGTPLRFTSRPIEGGEERTVTLRPVLDEEEGRPIIGVITVANFPFDVRIESADIGGPSAGLMWALGVTDLLTPEDLTGERTLAGTGTVDLAGNVGPIGGIVLKLAAAERAGAEIFILPQDNIAEARASGSDMRLVPVSTVSEAIDFLEASA